MDPVFAPVHTTLFLSLGHSVRSETVRASPDEAGGTLPGYVRRHYSYALRRGTDVFLHRRIFRCPYCGGRTPLCPDFFPPDKRRTRPCATRSQVMDWCDPQLRWFDPVPARIRLAGEVRLQKTMICPRCGLSSSRSERNLALSMDLDAHSVRISFELSEIGDLFRLDGPLNHPETLFKADSFPLREVLTFDFRRGRVYLQLRTADGKIPAAYDLTTCPGRLTGGVMHDALLCKSVRRALKRCFARFSAVPFPYSYHELDFFRFVLLTRFVGYARPFYDAIPFFDNEWKLDASFRDSARALRFASDVPALVAASPLSRHKSVRRLLYLEPGLLFYRSELEKLEEVLGDVNLFRAALTSPVAYRLLEYRHSRPLTSVFLTDYVAAMGAVKLVTLITRHFGEFECLAGNYPVLNDAQKKREREKWKLPPQKRDHGYRAGCRTYSYPTPAPEAFPGPGLIGRHTFIPLTDKNAFCRAGDELCNCLGSFYTEDARIVLIRRGEEAVAAVELEGAAVVQAHTRDNRDIPRGSLLEKDITAWCKRYRLRMPSDAPDRM